MSTRAQLHARLVTGMAAGRRPGARASGIFAVLLAVGAGSCAPSVRRIEPPESRKGVSASASVDAAASERAPGPVASSAAGEDAREDGAVSEAAARDHSLLAPSALSSEPAPRVVARPMAELAAFYDTLDQLVSGGRASSSRVLWLGDSHTAADFMTGVVRQRFADGFGWPAAGFVRVGLAGYRHGAVNLELSGKWRKAPILPAQRTRVLDGVFGYGGIRTIPESGASVTIKPPRERAGEPLVYTLAFRGDRASSLSVRVGEQEHVVEGSEQLAEVRFEAPLGEPVRIAHRSGMPEVFGLFVDTLAPRLVLDTVGIDGARMATTLAWEPEQFVSAVRARAPSLVVLSYGTNEVFDQTRVSHYAGHLEQLVGLLRRANPDLPCLVLGPPDAPGVSEATRPRVVEITAAEREAAARLGCAFFSLYEAMGGEGSFRRWMGARPGLARGDGIHFTIAGYQKLGGLVADALLGPAAGAAPTAIVEPLVALHQRAVEPRP